MPTEIYRIDHAYTIDRRIIELSPLKLRYLKEFMNQFSTVKDAKDDQEAISIMAECARIAMKQYAPDLSDSVSQIEDNFDLHSIYKILDSAAGIKINETDSAKDQAVQEKDDSSWDDFDLARLETEVFLLGIWKNYEELETSISVPELTAIINSRRELDYDEKKFLAALQGINLDEQSGGNEEVRGQQEWENLKARVFSGGATGDANDVLSLQGVNAQKAGFGIGMGLSYEVVKG